MTLFAKYSIPLEDPSQSPRTEKVPAIASKDHNSSPELSRTLIQVIHALIEEDDLGSAVEKLTHAIDLTSNALEGSLSPPEVDDLIALRSCRSSANVKLQRSDTAIEDLDFILIKKPDHIKARLRRAHILEAQEDRIAEAFDDYVCVHMLEQKLKHNGHMVATITSSEEKAHEICQRFAAQRTSELMEILLDKSRQPLSVTDPTEYCSFRISDKVLQFPLPENTLICNYLESFPNYFLWKGQYLQEESRDDLQNAVLEYKAMIAIDQHEANQMYAEYALHLICYNLVHGKFEEALELLHTLSDDMERCQMLAREDSHLGGLSKSLLSLFYELCGIEVQCRAPIIGHDEAISLFRKCQRISITPMHAVSIALKIIKALLDVGKLEEATQEIERLWAQWQADSVNCDAATSRTYFAWILIFRADCWSMKGDFGNEQQSDAISNALSDLEEALKLTSKYTFVDYAFPLHELLFNKHRNTIAF
jgi:tetratricopeptide (TPR) repeat protein